MLRLVVLTLITLLSQIKISAEEAFKGWPEDKATVYCGAMAMFNQYLNADSDGNLPPYTEDQQYWWDQTLALYPDKDELQQELTLAGQSFEAYFLRASANETNPDVTRNALAATQDTTCSKYRIERRIRELKTLRAKQQLTLDAHKEIARREKAEQSITFDEPPFVNLRNNESAATLDIYFSLGCNHCLLFLDEHLTGLLKLNREGRLNLRFLEVPGLTPYMIGNGTIDRPTVAARQRAQLASRYAACAAKQSPASFTDFVTQLMASAQAYVPTIETQDWEYYTHAVAADFQQNSPVRSVQDMLANTAKQLNISVSSCDETFAKTYTEQAFSILKTLRGEINVPFYRFNGAYYLDGDAHEKLLTDLKTYTSRLPVVR